MSAWQRLAALAMLASFAALASGCGSRAGSAVPITPAPSSTLTQPTSAPMTPAGSPTPVPGGPTDPLQGGVWRTQIVLPDGTHPLPVVLRDATGLVTGLAAPPAAMPLVDEGVANVDGQPDRLTYTWVGGACDTVTNLTFEAAGNGFRLRAESERSGGACILIGLGRTVAISLARPVDAGSVILAED
jgi:hypothetical protein